MQTETIERQILRALAASPGLTLRELYDASGKPGAYRPFFDLVCRMRRDGELIAQGKPLRYARPS